MPRSIARVVLAAMAAALATVPAAWADDTELFVKSAVPPNVLVILDTSQSMTWYDQSGTTVGDEFDGNGVRSGSRLYTAKAVLDTVVTQYSDKVNFGLASYYQGDNATSNVKLATAANGAPMAWYYNTGWAQWPFGGVTSVANRFYINPYYFDVRVPQGGLGGPGNSADLNGYDPATLRPNVPSFTLTWLLQSRTPNPQKTMTRAAVAGQSQVSHNEDRCRYQNYRSPDDVTYTPYGGTWDTAVGGGCPAVGYVPGSKTYTAMVTVTVTCTFVRRLTVDSPKPYQYNCQRYTNGSASGGPWPDNEANDRGATFTYTQSTTPAYYQQQYTIGQVTIAVIDQPFIAGAPAYYAWTYYYEATCKSNCANTGRFWQWTWQTDEFPDDANCQAGTQGDPWNTVGVNAACRSLWGRVWSNGGTPAFVPYAGGGWNAPMDSVYAWGGNNYQLAADTSCDPAKGAQVLVEVGSGTQGEIKNFLGTGADRTKELHAANASTPLAGALQSAYDYITNPEGIILTDAQKECRKNFVILVTDGGESCLIDLSLPGQKTAALLGLSDPPGGVKTYVVGLDQGGLSTDERRVLDDIASQGGTFNFYPASNPAQLLTDLQTILGEILSTNYSFASIIVPRMRFRDNLIAVQAAMLPNTTSNVPFWKGYLTAYQLQNDGTLPTDANHLLDQSSVVKYWEAAAQLDATSPNDRNILITLYDTTDPNWQNWGYKTVPFMPTAPVYGAIRCQWTFGNFFVWMNSAFPDVNSDGSHTVADCQAFVNLLRGSNLFNWGSKLGDIFHSQPVIVGSPSPTYVDTDVDPTTGATVAGNASSNSFTAYRNLPTIARRDRIVVVGSNDGFLHAFNAGIWQDGQGAYDTGTGNEEWAYVPYNVASALQALGNKLGSHGYFVDGSPKVADVWLDDDNDNAKKADGTEWHTVMLMNLRQGGSGIFHLDVTDTKNPKPLSNGNSYYTPYWYTCGQSWSEPAIGKVKVKIGGTIVDRWTAFFGGGDTSSFTWQSLWCGKQFYAVDLKTGYYLWYLSYNRFGGGGTDETRFMQYDMVSSPIAVDLNGDGYIDRVYIGDRGGQIWRFDVSAVGTSGGGNVDPLNYWTNGVDNWKITRLFASATATQLFYMRAASAFDDKGNLWIFAGTGNRANPTSLNDPDDAGGAVGKGTNGRLFGIRDTYMPGGTIPAPWVESDLEDVTGVNTLNPADLSKAGGWEVKLEKGEKLFDPVEIFNKVVFFSTVKPGITISGTGCTTSPASARLYALYYLTGGGATDVAAFRGSPPTASDRYVTLGSGAPVRTIVSTLALGGGAVLLTGTNEQVLRFGTGAGTDLQLNAPTNLRFTNYWRNN